MDRWEKIISLHRLLKTARYSVPLTRILDELAPCNRSTFHRTRSFLESVLKAPIVFYKRTGGYRYDHDGEKPFELPGLWFTGKEIESMFFLESTLANLQPGFVNDTLSSLRERFAPIFKAQKISPDAWKNGFRIIPLANRKVHETIFRTVVEAVLRQRQLEINYRKIGSDDFTSRTISPFTLLRYRDNWYVDAHCHLRNTIRSFALSRVLDARLLRTKIIRPDREELTSYFTDAYGIFSGKATTTAIIRFTGTAAIEVAQEEWHPRQEGKLQPDGSYLLSIPVADPTELIMDVLRWGEEAEIVEPPQLRSQIAKRLETAAGKYR